MLIGIFEKAINEELTNIEILIKLLNNKTTDNIWNYSHSTTEIGYEAHVFKEKQGKFKFNEFVEVNEIVKTVNANKGGLTIVMTPKTMRYIAKIQSIQEITFKMRGKP